MKKKKVLIIFILCVLVIGIPYMNLEIKTYKYGDQFKDRYTDTNMIESIEYYKVFSYSETKAKVLYVELGHETVNLVWFKKENGCMTIVKQYGLKMKVLMDGHSHFTDKN